VRYWLSRGIPYGAPESRNKRRKGFDSYASYVEERIRQGCRNGQVMRDFCSSLLEVSKESSRKPLIIAC
jgi:hypothetical protein